MATEASTQTTMTVAEAAEQLGISPQAVRKLLRHGTLTGWQDRVSKQWHTTPEAVSRRLAEQGYGQEEPIDKPAPDLEAVRGAIKEAMAEFTTEVVGALRDLTATITTPQQPPEALPAGEPTTTEPTPELPDVDADELLNAVAELLAVDGNWARGAEALARYPGDANRTYAVGIDDPNVVAFSLLGAVKFLGKQATPDVMQQVVERLSRAVYQWQQQAGREQADQFTLFSFNEVATRPDLMAVLDNAKHNGGAS